MAARRNTIDWQSIEREYYAGEDSIREIADRYCVSDTAIRKRAKQEGWVREVRRRDRVRTLLPIVAAPPPPPIAKPVEPVDAAQVAEHGRQLIARMFDELDAVTSHQGELERVIEIATIDNEDDRQHDAMLKAISLPARTAMVKNLATALKTINETAAPQGKKAAAQGRAQAVGARFGSMAPPGAARSVN